MAWRWAGGISSGGESASRGVDFERWETAVAGVDRGSHGLERLDDALHGAARERLVARDAALEWLGGEDSREHSNGGAGVAGVERRVGRMEAAWGAAGAHGLGSVASDGEA